MRNQVNRIVCLGMCVWSLTASCGVTTVNHGASSLEAIIQVVDEKGILLHDCFVTASFRHTDRQKDHLGTWIKKFEVKYDGEKAVKFSYRSDRTVAIEVTKDGYWSSGFRHNFVQEDRTDGGTEETDHYRKEFTVVLRKKENPRPLYVNKSELNSTDEFAMVRGYDLEIGDMVAPHGKGVSARMKVV